MKAAIRTRWPRSVAIVGTGLIGTSLGLALRRSKSGAPTVVGWDVRPAAARAALKRGGITKIARSLEAAVTEADLVVVATPLDAAIKLLPRVIHAAAPGALVIDVTPVKAPILAVANRALRRRRDVDFVSTHPMAGQEKGGAQSANAALFTGRPFAIVAAANRQNVAQAMRRVTTIAKRIGAIPVRMSVAGHDKAIAASSALPQLASIALAIAVASAGGGRARALAGPGVRDAMRLARSPFDIWGPALAANRAPVVRALRALERALALVADAARQPGVRQMERLFSRARAARRRVVGE